MINAKEMTHEEINNNMWKPDRCPVTQRPFFMWLEHPELGMVPTYGGPFDSYTIPVAENLPDDGKIEWDEIEMTYQQYDHDEGGWKNWVEHCSIKLIDETKLIDLVHQEKARLIEVDLLKRQVGDHSQYASYLKDGELHWEWFNGKDLENWDVPTANGIGAESWLNHINSQQIIKES